MKLEIVEAIIEGGVSRRGLPGTQVRFQIAFDIHGCADSVRPTSANEPRAVSTHRRVGSIRVLARELLDRRWELAHG